MLVVSVNDGYIGTPYGYLWERMSGDSSMIDQGGNYSTNHLSISAEVTVNAPKTSYWRVRATDMQGNVQYSAPFPVTLTATVGTTPVPIDLAPFTNKKGDGSVLIASAAPATINVERTSTVPLYVFNDNQGSFIVGTGGAAGVFWDYQWEYVSGDTDMVIRPGYTAQMNLLLLGKTMNPGETASAVWKCTVTAGTETVVTNNVTITLHVTNG
jgi:hypothetical protein